MLADLRPAGGRRRRPARAAGGSGVATLLTPRRGCRPLSVASPPVGWLWEPERRRGRSSSVVEAGPRGAGAWRGSRPTRRGPVGRAHLRLLGRRLRAAWAVFAYVPGAIEDPGHGEIGAGMVEGWPLGDRRPVRRGRGRVLVGHRALLVAASAADGLVDVLGVHPRGRLARDPGVGSPRCGPPPPSPQSSSPPRCSGHASARRPSLAGPAAARAEAHRVAQPA